MKRLLKLLLVAIILFVLLAGSFGAGIFMGSSGAFLKPGVVRAQDQPADFEVFLQVWNLAHNYFIDRTVLDNKKLTYGAINGLITALGDEGHTRFMSPQEVKRQETDMSGKFFGIGAQVGVKDGLPVIIAPMDGSPAEKAGIKAGDIILKVNGEDVTAMQLSDVIDRIRGQEGTSVVLTLFRPKENKSLEFSLVRAEIKLEAASWTMVPGTKVGLIRLIQFSANLNTEVTQAITETQAAGATALILDVRNNPGGLLEQAVKVTSQFVKDGNVLLQEDADGKREPYPVEKGGLSTAIPLVVLTNEGTASSAEIFAGAIQDHQRGQVIGETTFATGTVLRPFQLDDGSALLLGTSQWLTPNGRLIRKQGIKPDIEVKLPVGSELLPPLEIKKMTLTEIGQSQDKQLRKALEVLGILPPSQDDNTTDAAGTVTPAPTRTPTPQP